METGRQPLIQRDRTAYLLMEEIGQPPVAQLYVDQRLHKH